MNDQTIRDLLDEIGSATTSRATEIIETFDTAFPGYAERVRWICDTQIETDGSVDLQSAAGSALPRNVRSELRLPEPPRRYKDLDEAELLRLSRFAETTWDRQMLAEIAAERMFRGDQTTGGAR